MTGNWWPLAAERQGENLVPGQVSLRLVWMAVPGTWASYHLAYTQKNIKPYRRNLSLPLFFNTKELNTHTLKTKPHHTRWIDLAELCCASEPLHSTGLRQDKRAPRAHSLRRRSVSVSRNAESGKSCSAFPSPSIPTHPSSPISNASSTRKPFPTSPARTGSLPLRVTYSLCNTLPSSFSHWGPCWFPHLPHLWLVSSLRPGTMSHSPLHQCCPSQRRDSFSECKSNYWIEFLWQWRSSIHLAWPTVTAPPPNLRHVKIWG